MVHYNLHLANTAFSERPIYIKKLFHQNAITFVINFKRYPSESQNNNFWSDFKLLSSKVLKKKSAFPEIMSSVLSLISLRCSCGTASFQLPQPELPRHPCNGFSQSLLTSSLRKPRAPSWIFLKIPLTQKFQAVWALITCAFLIFMQSGSEFY